MEKIIDLNNFIQNVTTGSFSDTGIILYSKLKKPSEIRECDAQQLAKCIVLYFNIIDDYPNLKTIILDNELYKSLLEDFEDYKNRNYVNIKLDNELKIKLNSYSKKELNLELRKYFQNLLTNKEVIKYIKEIIDKKDYYFYEKYDEYTKEQCVDEIETLKQIFIILDKLEFRNNKLGIKEKYISFEPGSYEYENISPFICFDVYDINHYKRVLELLENKLKNNYY